MIPVKGSAVRLEPFEHLTQHIKQTDPRLYEALKRMSQYTSEIQINNEAVQAAANQDKATFGLQRGLTISQGLTLYYICRKAGNFIDCTLKNKIAPDSTTNLLPTILDIEKSVDDGGTWVSIFNSSAKITIGHGSSGTLLIPKDKFAIPSIDVLNLLRINCVQIAVPNPGGDIEVVLRWA